MENSPQTNTPTATPSMPQPPQPVEPVLYYALKDGVQVGPYIESTLHTQVASGALPADVPVWKEGMTEWLAYNQVFAAGESSSQKMLETGFSFLKKVGEVVQESAQKAADKVREHDSSGTFHKINETLKEYGDKATHLVETYQDGKKSVGWKKRAMICGYAVMVLIGGIWLFSGFGDNFQKWVAYLEETRESQQQQDSQQQQQDSQQQQQDSQQQQQQDSQQQQQQDSQQQQKSEYQMSKMMQRWFDELNKKPSGRTYSGEELREAARQKRRMAAFDNEFGVNEDRITSLMRVLALAEQKLAKAMAEGRTNDVADLEQYIRQKKLSARVTLHLQLGAAKNGDREALADLADARKLADSLYAKGWLAYVGRCLLFLILLVIGILLYRSRWMRSHPN